MVEDEKESLLGKEDAVKLGIIKLDPEGEAVSPTMKTDQNY